MTGSLAVDGLVCGYGHIEALHGVSLRVDPGEAVAIVGANGAGKTTLLRAIAGLVTARRGLVRVDGREVTRWPVDEPSMGLAPRAVADVVDALTTLVRGSGRPRTTVVLVEQNAHAAFAVAGRGYVLDRGTVAVAGPTGELYADPRVQAAYLGGAV